MIVLADRRAIYQLLDKKGNTYSERPHLAVPTFMSRGCHMTFEQASSRTTATALVCPGSLEEASLPRPKSHVYDVVQSAANG